MAIADGIDAQTSAFPLLIEGFEVSVSTLMTFTCRNNDESIVGHDVVTCLPNGTWSGPYPTRCGLFCWCLIIIIEQDIFVAKILFYQQFLPPAEAMSYDLSKQRFNMQFNLELTCLKARDPILFCVYACIKVVWTCFKKCYPKRIHP